MKITCSSIRFIYLFTYRLLFGFFVSRFFSFYYYSVLIPMRLCYSCKVQRAFNAQQFSMTKNKSCSGFQVFSFYLFSWYTKKKNREKFKLKLMNIGNKRHCVCLSKHSIAFTFRFFLIFFSCSHFDFDNRWDEKQFRFYLHVKISKASKPSIFPAKKEKIFSFVLFRIFFCQKCIDLEITPSRCRLERKRKTTNRK